MHNSLDDSAAFKQVYINTLLQNIHHISVRNQFNRGYMQKYCTLACKPVVGATYAQLQSTEMMLSMLL